MRTCIFTFILILLSVSLFSQERLQGLDSLILIIQDTSLIRTDAVKLGKALKEFDKFEPSVAIVAAPYIINYLSDPIVIDTLEYLKYKEAYSSFIPIEYSYPAINTAISMGELILPVILSFIVNNDTSL